MKVTVTCREIHYAHKSFVYGQEIEMPEKDAKVLKVLRKVAYKSAPDVRTPEGDDRPARSRRRRYDRRDMWATESDQA